MPRGHRRAGGGIGRIPVAVGAGIDDPVQADAGAVDGFRRPVVSRGGVAAEPVRSHVVARHGIAAPHVVRLGRVVQDLVRGALQQLDAFAGSAAGPGARFARRLQAAEMAVQQVVPGPGDAGSRADGRIGQLLLVGVGVHPQGDAQLLEIAQAGGRTGLGLRLGQGRQQHGRQDPDDRDDDQEFDQGEGAQTPAAARREVEGVLFHF